MNKILSIRIAIFFSASLLVSACGAGPEKRVNTDEKPFSARARNTLATENPEGLLRVGQGFERSGNLQGALNIYGQTMAAAPDLIEAQVGYARVMGALGAHDRSISMLTGLLEIYPNNQLVRITLANANIRAGQFKFATLLLEPILEVKTASPDLLDLGGRLAQVSGQTEKARKLFGRALDLLPNEPKFLRHMALSFALEGDYPAAVAMIQKSMDKSTGLISGKKDLALVYALSGQFSSAMQLARGAMSSEEVNTRRFVYRNIANWPPEHQAMAVLFDQFPKDLLSASENAAK